MRANLLAVVLTLLPFAARAAPPPPPPEFIDNAARVLSADLTPQNFEDHANLFADDLHVFEDGRLIASNKSLWLDRERGQLGKVERHLIGYAEGRDNVLIVDEFDDRSGLPVRPGLLFDPRFVTRAVRYSFGEDHLVHEVRLVQGGGFWMSMRRGS